MPALLGAELGALCVQERAEVSFSTFCIKMCVFQGVAQEGPAMDLQKATRKVTCHIKGWAPLLW